MTLLSGDRDSVHLFTLDLDEEALWPFVTPDPDTGASPLRAALGVERLDESQIEPAMAEDLDGIGLAGFMTEGLGVDEALIAPDRARIDALTGAVLVIRGAAFDGADVPLTPVPPLRHVGTWHMTPAASSFEPLTSEAARGNLATAAPPAPKVSGRSPRGLLWLGLGIALLILLALLLTGALA